MKPPSVGFVVGALAAADAFQPSLLPTPTVDRGVAAAASAVTAGAAAGAAGAALRTAPARAVAVGAGVAVARTLSRRQGEHLGWATVRTAAMLTALGSGTGVAISALRRRPLVAWAATGALLGLTLRERLRRHRRDGGSAPDPSSIAAAIGIAAAGVAVAHTATGSGTLTAATGLATGAGLRALVRRHEDTNNRMEPGYRTPPTAATVSGGPDSAVDFAAMGAHGRRFVLEATTAGTISEVVGEAAITDPVRVYVGYRNAATIESRVALAVEELRRCGAFDRSLLVVASPSGTGYVNYIAAEACEYLTGGDCAWVAVQYGMRPSIISADRLIPGGRHHRALLEGIAAECRRMTAPPRVVVFGESLGAHTSQNAFLHRGISGLDEVGVERALYVGTPYRSKWRSQVLAAAHPEVARFDSIADHEALDAETAARLRVFLLEHHNDPVTKFGIDLAVQRPSWLGPPESRPATISRSQRWTPLVTFWQTLLDTKNAATVLPGRFGATGHDYRADLARFVRVAYDVGDVTEAQLAAIEERLRRSDEERNARVEDVAPPPPVLP